MATVQRRRLVNEPESDGDMKGLILILICYMYAIFLFVAAAVCTKIFRGLKSSCKFIFHTLFLNYNYAAAKSAYRID